MKFDPDNLEQELKQALSHEQPSSDFAAKVLARAAALERPAARRVIVIPIWRKPAAWAIAAGLTLTALLPVGIAEYRYRQEQKAKEAGRQLALALKITRAQLQKTRERLQKVSKQHAL